MCARSRSKGVVSWKPSTMPSRPLRFRGAQVGYRADLLERVRMPLDPVQPARNTLDGRGEVAAAAGQVYRRDARLYRVL